MLEDILEVEKEIDSEILNKFPDLDERQKILTYFELGRMLPPFSSFIPRISAIATIGEEKGRLSNVEEIKFLYPLIVGKVFIYAREPKEALKTLEISIAEGEKVGNKKNSLIARLYRVFALFCAARTSDGFAEYEKIEKEIIQIYDEEILLDLLLIKGSFYLLSNQWINAEDIFNELISKSESLSKEIKDFYSLYGKCGLSQILSLKGDTEDALELLKDAVKISSDYEALGEQMDCLCKLSTYYIKTFRFTEAIRCIENMEQIMKSLQRMGGFLNILLWLPLDLTGVKDLESLISFGMETLQKCAYQSDIEGYLITVRLIIATFLAKKMTEKGIDFLANVIEGFKEVERVEVVEELSIEKKELQKFFSS